MSKMIVIQNAVCFRLNVMVELRTPGSKVVVLNLGVNFIFQGCKFTEP